MAFRLFILTLAALLGGTARAQLAADPASLSVTMPQHETATRTVTLTNTGSTTLSFCLSFDRPLKRTVGTTRISSDVLGGACGEYGEVLLLADRGDVPTEYSWDPYGLTMTPDGRVFGSDKHPSPFGRTVELTPELEYVRDFPSPYEAELDFSPSTTGLAYNSDTGTLWWLNREATIWINQFWTLRALLIEGDLNGVSTGRRIEVPVAEESTSPINANGAPVGLSYDPTQKWFYITDIANETIYAVDTLGNVAPGYPVQMEGYPGATIARGINVVPAASLDGAEAGAEGLRLELYINPPGETPPRHIGVVGRYGEDTAPGAEPLETPFASDNPWAETGTVSGEAVRSLLDPNGVLYYPWGAFEGDKGHDSGVVGIRPHPLPPSWLVVEAWRGTLDPGESTEITLTFRPGDRALGEYTAVLQAFEAETGEAVEVPLTLTVTQGTDTEDEPAASEASSLTVHPNPTAGRATVTFVLPAAAEVRAAVYDVLGREVAVLHDGPLATGSHRLTFPDDLPAGVYLVRATGGGINAAQRVTVVR